MNSFVIFAILFACAVAKPQGTIDVSQDTAGNFALSYENGDAKVSEKASADGTALGSYEFVDKEGKTHVVQYTVGADGGYHAEGADVPVDTPAIAAVKAAHLAQLEKQRRLLPALEDEQ